MSTWHWDWKGQSVTFRLDYIFHNSRFKTHTSKVIVSDASDHYLVVSQLSIEKPTSQPASQP
ncbi:MAG: hypothetical protein EHM48_05990 [Planctomycetaceae bacterium]|nr:MAG: hypothetical protein EHM48_05990 [Planctomycetaceae bacterium]